VACYAAGEIFARAPVEAQPTNAGGPPKRSQTDPRWRAWTDLSLRTKLMLFALALVTLPGVVFALVAFSGARAALEREVGLQLQRTAERGADALASALEKAQSDVRSWASQDVMRDLVVGDLDKRVSKLLHTVTVDKAPYVEVLCVDGDARVVAASSGDWIGRSVREWKAMGSLLDGGTLVGPTASKEFGREVLQIGVPIRDPDPPGGRIGSMILIYDWDGIQDVLDAIRVKLENLDKRVAAIVVDREGKVIGGVSFDGRPAERSALVAESWAGSAAKGRGTHRVDGPGGPPVAVLVGAASVSSPANGWSVLFVERTDEALAAVATIRSRWIVVIACILLVGLVVAVLLARQFMRPLDEVTRATASVASHPELVLPLLPVRSRNEVGQLAESFNKMTVELKRSQEEALSAAKFAFAGELAAMVAHEVRTPLSVMRSSAQMLASPAPAGSADNAELVETIVAEVDRIERVVTGLIQLARPVEQRPEPTLLSDLLSRAAEFASAQAKRQGIRITCELAGGERPALCDPEQLYQVVLNLVVNALQALPPGGRILLRTLREDSGTVGLEVADDGPGLPGEIRDRIFRPFVTGREGGTGLGLAFVDRIVKAHRGTVSVRGGPGEGAVFTVRLPLAPEERI
jgi:two-component system, NtrC family, sensor histidine kinase HydH